MGKLLQRRQIKPMGSGKSDFFPDPTCFLVPAPIFKFTILLQDNDEFKMVDTI